MSTITERLDKSKDAPRSVSQYKQFNECGLQYYYDRIEKVWKRTAAWFSQGTALHEAAEAFDRSGRTMPLEDMEQVYSESYAKHINRDAAETPNLDYWFASGPYKGFDYTGSNGKFYQSDITRRYELGLAMVGRYRTYYTEIAPEEVTWYTPDGTPGIELPFNIELAGVKVRGYIDSVIRKPKGQVIVRDIKSGNKPGDDFQLAVYAEAIRQQYGQEVWVGDYWMGRNGKPTVPYKLGVWDHEALAKEFKAMDEAVKAEDFEPNPEPNRCGFCSVATSCSFFAG